MKSDKNNMDDYLEQTGLSYQINEEQLVRKIVRKRKKRQIGWFVSGLFFLIVSGFTSVKILPIIYETYFGTGASDLMTASETYEVESNGVKIKVLDQFQAQNVKYAVLQMESDIEEEFYLPMMGGYQSWQSIESKGEDQLVILESWQEELHITHLLTQPHLYQLQGELPPAVVETEWLDNTGTGENKKWGIRPDLLAFDKNQPYALAGVAQREDLLHLQFYGAKYGETIDDFLEQAENGVFLIDKQTGEKVLPIDFYDFSKVVRIRPELGAPYYLEYIFDVEDPSRYMYQFAKTAYKQIAGEWPISFSEVEKLPVLDFESIETKDFRIVNLQLSPISLKMNTEIYASSDAKEEIEIKAVMHSGEEKLLLQEPLTLGSSGWIKTPYTDLKDVAFLKINNQKIWIFRN